MIAMGDIIGALLKGLLQLILTDIVNVPFGMLM